MAAYKCTLSAWLALQLLRPLQGRRCAGGEFLASESAVLHLSRCILRRWFVPRRLLGAVAAAGAGCVSASFIVPTAPFLRRNMHACIYKPPNTYVQRELSEFNKSPNHGRPGESANGEWFRKPQGIAFDGDGRVAVTCSHCVQIFHCGSKTPVLSFGSFGSDDVMFKYPWGIAFDGKGLLIVADGHNHRVQVFRSSDGSHLRNIPCSSFPAGLCSDGRGNIVVQCQDGPHRCLRVFRLSDGAKVREFSDRTRKHPVHVSGCGDVTFDADGNLVACSNGGVQVIDYNSGMTLRAIGSTEKSDGVSSWIAPRTDKDLINPVGVALDGAGHIAVADADSGSIQIYRYSDGQHVRTISTQCERVCGIAIDGEGRMLVCDVNNNRVQVLQ